jgi:hypothetical protein
MAIRKILLPLQLTAAAATFSMAVIVARLWRAHLAVLHAAASRNRESAVHDLFERLTTEHGLAVAESRPNADEATASFATLIGREPGRYCSPPGEAGRFDCGAASRGR